MLRFQPPKLLKAIGTGRGTFTPTIPTWIWRTNSRATPPSRVNTATPLPYSLALISSTALPTSGKRTTHSTGPKISSL